MSSSALPSPSPPDAKNDSVLGTLGSTAEATAMMRVLHPPWKSLAPSSSSSSSSPSSDNATADLFGVTYGDDPYAKLFVQSGVVDKCVNHCDDVISRFQQQTPGTIEWLWGRTRLIDRLVSHFIRLPHTPSSQSSSTPSSSSSSSSSSHHLQQQPQQQLLIMGAGYDTRGLRFAQSLDATNTSVYELDLAHTQQRKRDILLTHTQDVVINKEQLSRIHFIPIDLSKSEDECVAITTAAGVNPSLRSIFIWEGVTAYLARASVLSSLRFFHRICAPGSRCIFTFISADHDRPDENATDAEKREHERRSEWLMNELKQKGEPHKFHPEVSEMRAIVEEAGWVWEELWDWKRIGSEILNDGHLDATKKIPIPLRGSNLAVAVKP